MPSHRVVRVREPVEGVLAEALHAGIAAIQEELGVTPDFPPEVEAAAEAAAAAPRLPALDRTDLPLVTLDPPGSRDLDQALHIERAGTGYVVHYAIADLAAFVTPGDPLDVEAHRRGETLYGADARVPLHPPVISEGAGSLLPGEERPALLWTIAVDETGEGTEVTVVRARVRSRARLSYEEAQEAVDAGPGADDVLRLLGEVGRLRLAREAARGGVSLPLPEQEVEVRDGRWHLEYRTLLPVEQWNAQISMLTGFAAASLMVYARVGLLRTLPPPDPRDLQRLHRTARALGVDWPAEQLYPDFIRHLDADRPAHAAMLVACTRLLRGSGYVGFAGEVPAQPQHSALVSEYAHVTAPLRRLGDRYAGEICLALCAGEEVPGWVLDRLAVLPQELKASAQRAHRYERMVLDLVEAGALADRVGDTFEAVVVDRDDDDHLRGVVVLAEEGIEAPVRGSEPLPLGHEVVVRLAEADPAARRVRFEIVAADRV